MSNKSQGRIIKFLNHKGFGFIAPDSGGTDIFVHSDSVADGAKISVGDVVRFDIGQDNLGRSKALNVELVD